MNITEVERGGEIKTISLLLLLLWFACIEMLPNSNNNICATIFITTTPLAHFVILLKRAASILEIIQ
jgi:hypothetical protein